MPVHTRVPGYTRAVYSGMNPGPLPASGCVLPVSFASLTAVQVPGYRGTRVTVYRGRAMSLP
eukprot:1866629-Rhodomonas_salina.1